MSQKHSKTPKKPCYDEARAKAIVDNEARAKAIADCIEYIHENLQKHKKSQTETNHDNRST